MDGLSSSVNPQQSSLQMLNYLISRFTLLNQPYTIQSQPEDVPLAGTGTFQNRRIELTWFGLSKRNNEMCALIQYHALMNKFTTFMGNMVFQGRSHKSNAVPLIPQYWQRCP